MSEDMALLFRVNRRHGTERRKAFNT